MNRVSVFSMLTTLTPALSQREREKGRKRTTNTTPGHGADWASAHGRDLEIWRGRSQPAGAVLV